MKFLIDAQLPPGLCPWLAARGHEAEHVFDLGLGSASDAEVAGHAAATGAVLISKDEDFVLRSRQDELRLLWLRCGNVTNRALGDWLEARWEQVESLLARGERIVELR